jgi:hypothetical protein
MLTKVVATESGNSMAIIVNVAVANPAFPMASTVLIAKDIEIKVHLSSILSNNPKRTQQVPVINIPKLNTFLGPSLLIYKSSQKKRSCI